MCSREFSEGLKLFNEGKYYDAHHVWESLWSKSLDQEKEFYQGLIQVAVALYLYEEKRFPGALKVFQRAKSNLKNFESGSCDVDVSKLLLDLGLIFMDVNYPENMASKPSVKISLL